MLPPCSCNPSAVRPPGQDADDRPGLFIPYLSLHCVAHHALTPHAHGLCMCSCSLLVHESPHARGELREPLHLRCEYAVWLAVLRPYPDAGPRYGRWSASSAPG